MKISKYLSTFFAAIAFNASADAAAPDNSNSATQISPENVVVMTLKDGEVQIQLFPDKAPRHVLRIKELVKRGFYNGLNFHRVIEGFMAQTGDPRGDGTGGSDLPDINIEYSDLKHVRGAISMARGTRLDSANSQFFICFTDLPSLDRQYTVFGQVMKGMELVDNIKKGDKNNNGKVTNPDKIIKMEMLSDIKKAA